MPSDFSEPAPMSQPVENPAVMALLHASPMAMVWIHCDGRIARANPAVEALLGCTPDQVVGKSAAGLMILEDQPALVQNTNIMKCKFV